MTYFQNTTLKRMIHKIQDLERAALPEKELEEVCGFGGSREWRVQGQDQVSAPGNEPSTGSGLHAAVSSPLCQAVTSAMSTCTYRITEKAVPLGTHAPGSTAPPHTL